MGNRDVPAQQDITSISSHKRSAAGGNAVMLIRLLFFVPNIIKRPIEKGSAFAKPSKLSKWVIRGKFDMRSVSSSKSVALKAQNNIAQGKRSGALGSVCKKKGKRPERAKDLHLIGLQTFALTGRSQWLRIFPKALPWAMCFSPFRALACIASFPRALP